MRSHKPFYERNLPHFQPEKGTFFLTYRLFGSIPISVLKEFEEHYQKIRYSQKTISSRRFQRLCAAYFQRLDNFLDKQLNEPYWLQDNRIAQIVYDSLLYNNGKKYDLWNFSIMPNHVHALLTPKESSPPLYSILQDHKKFTALKSNRLLQRDGQFWEHETYDRVVRKGDEFGNIVNYILNNPVKAGFVKHWSDWKWTYLHPSLLEEFSPNQRLGVH
jgi:REP-associated tyrosine transposase